MAMNDNLVKVDAKGNWSIYSFDRSLMLDVAVSTPVRFDDLTILAAQSILNEFLSETIESKLSYVKDFVRDAFSTSRGKLDTKKVVGLLKWQTKINSEKYDKACELIKKAIVRPDSKTYYRIFVKDGEGEYQCIDLNFSNI